MDSIDSATTGRSSAIQTIESEHRALGSVVQVLQHLLRDLIAGRSEPDFTLLAAALYYIDDFACRCHHPKEEQYLFTAIRRHAPAAGVSLAGLQSEHHRDDHFVRSLHRLLVLYQAGAPGALERLQATLDMYAAMLSEHMCKEEALLDTVGDAIPSAEWQVIVEGFGREDEPIFGPAPQKEFDKLRARIISMLPRKMRLHSTAGQPD